jgi:hypothetical protein
MAAFSGRWTSRPFAWRSSGTVATLDNGHGEVDVEVRPAPSPEHRGWADLIVSPRNAYLGWRGGEAAGTVRLSPADVRRLRDALSKVTDDSEVAAFGGRV